MYFIYSTEYLEICQKNDKSIILVCYELQHVYVCTILITEGNSVNVCRFGN